MSAFITLQQVKDSLVVDDFDVISAQLSMLPLGRPVERPKEREGRARVGAVLLLLYCKDGQLHLVLTKRRDDLKAHGGQISFAGGRQEADETLQQTAVRETHEEIGVHPDEVEILGPLSQVYIPPSDFEVQPFVGWVKNGRPPSFIPSDDEVSEIIEISIDDLLDDGRRKTERRRFRGKLYDVPYFDIHGHQVWGATAVILNELLERLR